MYFRILKCQKTRSVLFRSLLPVPGSWPLCAALPSFSSSTQPHWLVVIQEKYLKSAKPTFLTGSHPPSTFSTSPLQTSSFPSSSSSSPTASSARPSGPALQLCEYFRYFITEFEDFLLRNSNRRTTIKENIDKVIVW